VQAADLDEDVKMSCIVVCGGEMHGRDWGSNQLNGLVKNWGIEPMPGAGTAGGVSAENVATVTWSAPSQENVDFEAGWSFQKEAQGSSAIANATFSAAYKVEIPSVKLTIDGIDMGTQPTPSAMQETLAGNDYMPHGQHDDEDYGPITLFGTASSIVMEAKMKASGTWSGQNNVVTETVVYHQVLGSLNGAASVEAWFDFWIDDTE